MKRRKFYLIIGLFVIFGALFFSKSLSVLVSQEGNVIPYALGITKLFSSQQELIKISEEPNPITYIAKTSSGSEPFIRLMESNGYQFKEQFGSGYLFEKNGEKIHAVSRQYSRFFTIWRFMPSSN